MKITKKTVDTLNKCYSLEVIEYRGKKHFLSAAEKKDACRMYSMDGQFEETIWEGPGGTMSMVWLKGTDGKFLATHRFYSPNDAKDAEIILASPAEEGWETCVLERLPFVHRFDILSCAGRNYLLACTIKSRHICADDWSSPGKVYAAELPENLDELKKGSVLELKVVKDNLLKNHGFYKCVRSGTETAVISCEQGVFLFEPPFEENGDWNIIKLTEEPASDAVLSDLDGCGQEELFVISPFHGDKIWIYKQNGGRFQKVYEHPDRQEFLHAIDSGIIGGRQAVIVGNRKNDRKLLAFFSDGQGGYEAETIDENTGAANVIHYMNAGEDIIIAANREIDEIAMYTIEPD